jgi:DNA topoisomerase-3
MMWHDDHVQEVTTVITAIRSRNGTNRRPVSHHGTVVRQTGWKILDVGEARRREPRRDAEQEAAEQALPATLAQGQPQTVTHVEALKKKTRPPQRFNDATILTAMQTAGKTLDEKELSDAMKETGLGTPATRAAIIEVLLKRGYVTRTGKSLEATDKGIHLIEVVHPEVKSPAMTGQWEAFLNRIQQGEAQLDPFLERISEYVRSVVGRVSQTTPVARVAASSRTSRDCGGGSCPEGHRQRRESQPATAKRLRLCQLPAQPGGGVQGSDRGRRRIAGNAHRLGQIALLSIAGIGARRNHAGDQSADCLDG